MAEACVGAAQLAHFMGQNERSRDLAAKGCEIVHKIGHVGLESRACSTLSNIARDEGNFESAHANLEAALLLARRSGSEVRIASMLNALAELHRADGRLDAAIPLYEEALSIARARDVREFIAVILVNLSAGLISRRECSRVAPFLCEALVIARDDSLRVVGWTALEVAAMLAAENHEWVRAAQLYGAQVRTTRPSSRRTFPDPGPAGTRRRRLRCVDRSWAGVGARPDGVGDNCVARDPACR